MSDKRELLFIHGAGDTGNDPNDVVGWLRKALADRFEVLRPQLPEPDPATWGEAIELLLTTVAEDAVLVGHSLGGSMLIKVIAERRPGLRASGLVLLAPPFWGRGGWDYEGFALPDGFAGSLTGLGAIVHLHGRDDEVVEPEHQVIYARFMPAARYLTLEDCGHDFAGPGRADILAAIESL